MWCYYSLILSFSLFPEHSSNSNGSGKGVMKLHFWFLITQNKTLFEAKQNNREWCQIYKQLEVRVRYSNLLMITVKTSNVKNVSNNESIPKMCHI